MKNALAPSPVRNKESTEAKLVEAAARLFIERGRQDTSLQDVAKAAGIPKRLIHFYFADEEDLVRKVARHVGR